MKLRYICCQPASFYYTWQVEVWINNILKHGLNPNDIDIVLGYTENEPPEIWRKMQSHYNTIRFFFYPDTRKDTTYVPNIYFHLMGKHITANPDLNGDALFLHDSDIIFTHKPDYSAMLNDKKIYLSDTNSYINYDYIQSKGNHVYLDMCRIVGIDPLIPQLMNSHSGGAQYLIKNATPYLFEKTEKDATELYKHFCKTEHLHIKKNEFDYPIQKWTAGMWSFLWNMWLLGHETVVDKRLDFTWATSPITDIEKFGILHNAGVTDANQRMFYKAHYGAILPYNVDLDIDETKCSYYYWNEIQETAKKTVL